MKNKQNYTTTDILYVILISLDNVKVVENKAEWLMR